MTDKTVAQKFNDYVFSNSADGDYFWEMSQSVSEATQNLMTNTFKVFQDEYGHNLVLYSMIETASKAFEEVEVLNDYRLQAILKEVEKSLYDSLKSQGHSLDEAIPCFKEMMESLQEYKEVVLISFAKAGVNQDSFKNYSDEEYIRAISYFAYSIIETAQEATENNEEVDLVSIKELFQKIMKEWEDLLLIVTSFNLYLLDEEVDAKKRLVSLALLLTVSPVMATFWMTKEGMSENDIGEGQVALQKLQTAVGMASEKTEEFYDSML